MLKQKLLNHYEAKLSRAIAQINLGMWYEHTERDNHPIVICHSPTGHDYEMNPATYYCSCPDTSRVHGLCKHLIGYDAWLEMNPPKLYQKVAKSQEDRELFRKKGLVILLSEGRLIYQNGRTVTSDPMITQGSLVPDFMDKYNSWKSLCK